MDNSKKIRRGDVIAARGHRYQVERILFQDWYGNRSGYDVEFIDSTINAEYHHWKQEFDGGDVIRCHRYYSTCQCAACIDWNVADGGWRLRIWNGDGHKIWESHYGVQSDPFGPDGKAAFEKAEFDMKAYHSNDVWTEKVDD